MELYSRFFPLLGWVVSSEIPPPVRARFDAEDVVQSGFLAAFRGLDGFDFKSGQSFRSWLCQIVTNRLRDRIRHHSRGKRNANLEQGDELGELIEQLGDRRTDEELVAIAEEYGATLERIAQLPPHQRSAIRLCLLEGRSAADAATELGVSEQTVRRRCERGIARLDNLAN